MNRALHTLLFSFLFTATAALPYTLLIKNETPYTIEVMVGKKTYTGGKLDDTKMLIKGGIWNLNLWTTVDRIYLKLNAQHASEIKALFYGKNELSFPIESKLQGVDHALKLYINDQNQLAVSSCW